MPSRASTLFVRGLLGLLVACTAGFACIYWRIYGADKLFKDFDIFYAAAHAAQRNLSAVYGIDHIRALLRQGPLSDFPFFLNPPSALFLVYPLNLLPPLPALIAWNVTQFLLLAAALSTGYARQLFALAGNYLLPLVVFLAFSLQNILFGQVAVFCTALLLLVMAWRTSRPVLAGIALGLLSFKPQLGILLPVLLLAERNGKVLLVAFLTALVTAGLSLGLWGGGLWHDYAQMLAIRGQFMAGEPSLLFTICTSAYASLRNLGLTANTAMLLQCALAAGVLVAIWPVLRLGKENDKLQVLVLATYLVTPYALIYDIVPLAIPATLWLKRAEADEASLPELLALLLLIALPLVAILLQIARIPYSIVAIAGAFGVARHGKNKG